MHTVQPLGTALGMTMNSRASRSCSSLQVRAQGLWERTSCSFLELLHHPGSCGLSIVSSGAGSWEVPSSPNRLRLRFRDPGRPYEALTGDSKSTSTSWCAPGSCSKATAGWRPACTHPERLPGRLVGLGDGSCNDADARQWDGSGERVSMRHCCVSSRTG